MHVNANSTNLRQRQSVFFKFKPELRIRQRTIAPMPLETWIANFFFACLNASEERFERKVNPHLGVLQNLAENAVKLWAFLFPLSQQLVSFEE